jgi:ketosteroid isomerase-like protein
VVSPLEVVQAILADPTNPDVVRALVAPNATYVSLNYDNPELKRIMPWAGTQTGPDAVSGTYGRVGRYWQNEGFEVEDTFESENRAAVFGRFTYRSATLGKAVTSPFAILARVRDGQVTYMQFMEDTFGTAATFRSGGTATFRADPDGGEVSV